MENESNKYGVAACEAKLKKFSYMPNRCPDPTCNKDFMSTNYLHHILDHHQINPMTISLMHPITLDVKPLHWPMDEVQVLAGLCFQGRSGHEVFNPVATKLTIANLDLDCTHEHLSNSLPMLLFGVRTTTAMFCDENILQHPHEPLTQIIFWISINTTTRPVFCTLELKHEGSPLRNIGEFEVQYFEQENCKTLRDMFLNTDQYLQVSEGTVINMCRGEDVPVKLSVTIKDYVDSKLGLDEPNYLENVYEAALDEYFLKMIDRSRCNRAAVTNDAELQMVMRS